MTRFSIKRHEVVLTACLLFFMALSFWVYSEGRTMVETVHFSIRGSLAGLVLVSICAGAPLVLTLIVRSWSPVIRRYVISVFVVAICASLMGCLLSECWVRYDESRFDSESRHASGHVYSRSRAWPNGGCTLVYVKGAGIHATD